jgi:twitching motility protein PilI
MQNNPEHTNSFSRLAFSQAMEHFDPYEGLVDTHEKEEQLRNLRYGFKIGDYHILINHKTLCEVVQHLQIYKLPNTYSWILGMINLRGNLVPVFDLKARLGTHSSDDDDVQLLVIEQGEHAAGIQLDGLPQALEIDPDNPEQEAGIPDNIPKVLKTHAQAAFHANGQTWLEIDHRGLFAELLAGSGIQAMQNAEAE